MISCDQYDFIEIACMYRMPVRLTLLSGDIVEGTALDTQRNNSKAECIKLESNGKEQLVELDNLVSMEACRDNLHFQRVRFNQAKPDQS